MQVEKNIKSIIEEKYNIHGALNTVVYGVNWTISVSINGKKRAFIRVYRKNGRSIKEISAELEALETIKSTDNLDVSRPIRNKDGGFCSKIEMSDGTERILAVFKSVSGRDFAQTQEDYSILGKALKDLHGQEKLTNIMNRRILIESDIEIMIGALSSRLKPILHVLKLQREMFYYRDEDISSSNLGFRHGDINPRNLKINSKKANLFDFDDCDLGNQLMDLASAALWLEIMNTNNSYTLWNSLLDGYGYHAEIKDKDFNFLIRRLMVHKKISSLYFLDKYCHLSDDMWNNVINNSINFINLCSENNIKTLHR